MASKNQIPDSDASEDSEIENLHTPEPEDEEAKVRSPPRSTLSHRFRDSPQQPLEPRKREKNSADSIAVMVPAPARPWEYQPYRGDTTVDTIIELKIMEDREWYAIDYEDGRRDLVSVLPLFSNRTAVSLLLSLCYTISYYNHILEIPERRPLV